ncbi:MAG: TolC family protein [Hydrococcus sp. SU_1_0]|nr:TolC family protein [Hydrococcus sp. SU_1_0]NJO97979.1 TolC family protein [Pleurocapsa sp. CRU_1_2]
MFKLVIKNNQSLALKVEGFLPLKILLLLSIAVVEVLLCANPVLTQDNSDSKTIETSQQRSRDSKTVELKLTDVVQLVVQNNRELKNSYLSRIVERQQLAEAEGKFSPTVTPNFSVSVSETLSDEPSFEDDFGDNNTGDFSEPVTGDSSESFGFENDSDFGGNSFERSLQIGAELLTPIGTNITLTADPISDFEVVGLEVRQPLMRGAGTNVNRASVKSARLTDTRQVLEVKRTSIDRITEGVKAYRALIQAQEEVKIRQRSLKSRRKDLQVQLALVESGRRAKADLVQLRSSVAGAEEQLLSSLNSQAQANADLLQIIDTDRNLNIIIPQEIIQDLTDRSLFRPVELDRESLLEQAYTQRPDYLQANLDLTIARFDVIEPKDDKRWQLDAVSNLNLGDSYQASAGLELTKELGDRSLQTAFETARVDILQKQNDLKESEETVRIEVRDRIEDVNSNLAQIEKARQAKELAQERLVIVQQLYRRGRGGIDIFEVTSQQDQVVEAQNTELNAIIGYLNAKTDLEQSLGTTLKTWQEFI